ncbi:MAG: hypothetical protein ACXVCX_12770, partial [Ktedonobacterales bacterium]
MSQESQPDMPSGPEQDDVRPVGAPETPAASSSAQKPKVRLHSLRAALLAVAFALVITIVAQVWLGIL